jgi:hypothetical protein
MSGAYSVIKRSMSTICFLIVVARHAWIVVSKMDGFNLGGDYESVAKLWLCIKKA